MVVKILNTKKNKKLEILKKFIGLSIGRIFQAPENIQNIEIGKNDYLYLSVLLY
jgi:hypothetical protein